MPSGPKEGRKMGVNVTQNYYLLSYRLAEEPLCIFLEKRLVGSERKRK